MNTTPDIVQYLNGLTETAHRAAPVVIALALARKHIEITRTAAARLAHQLSSLARAADDPRYGACRVTISFAEGEVAFSTQGLGYVVSAPIAEIHPELVAAVGESEAILAELADGVGIAVSAVRAIAAADATHMSAIGHLRGARPAEREEAQAALDAAAAALEAARDAARPTVYAQIVRAREVIRPLAVAAEAMAPGSGTFFSPEPGADVAAGRALDALYRAYTSETLAACRALVEGSAA